MASYFQPAGATTRPASLASLYRPNRPTGLDPGYTGLAKPPQVVAPVAPPAPTFTPEGVNSFVQRAGGFQGLQAGAAPAPSGGGGMPSFSFSSDVDYSSDPILQRVRALADSQMQQAQAQALAAEKTNLIRYGDPDLAAKVLGKDAGDTVDAARNNSFGTVPELNRWNARQLTNIDETRNQQNLFYSTTRQRDRALQQEDLVRQKTNTAAQLQDVLTGIANQLTQAKQQAAMMIMQAEEAAYSRALSAAMAQAQMAAYASMYGGGGYGGGGGDVPTGAAAAPAAAGGVQAAKAALGYGTSIPWTAGF